MLRRREGTADRHGHRIARLQSRLPEILHDERGEIGVHARQLGFEVAARIRDQAELGADQAGTRRVVDEVDPALVAASSTTAVKAEASCEAAIFRS